MVSSDLRTSRRAGINQLIITPVELVSYYPIVQFTTIIAFVVGLRCARKLKSADKVVLLSLAVSIYFDISFYIHTSFYSGNIVAHFYPLVNTVIWAATYTLIFKKAKTERTIVITFSIASIAAIIYLLAQSDLGSQRTQSPTRAVNYLFLIILSIIYFFHAIFQNEKSDFLKSSFFWYSAINLIHFSTAIVIFTFFEVIVEQETLLFASMLLKWILLAASNLMTAFVFYGLYKGTMQSE